jgi:3-hydroxybutyryl-CoA dehydrogenase
MTDPLRIAVIGAGFMGCAISTLYARHGYWVALHDSNAATLDTFSERAEAIAESLSDDEHSVPQILANVTTERKLDAAVHGAVLVHEIVEEILPVKQSLFAKLDSMCTPDVVLATNTSSFMLSEICVDVKERGRVIGIHFITPAHIIPAVELIHADFTAKTTIDWARTFLRTIQHVGVACSERPGFLVNRIQFAILSEIQKIVQEGQATIQDIDLVFRYSLGPRYALWGPFLTDDLVVNKKTVLAVWQYLHEKTGESRYANPALLRDKIDEGSLGAVAGRGWYEFRQDYPTVVKARDTQLKSLLDWLQQENPLAAFGLRGNDNAG